MDARVARTRSVVLETATDLLVEGGPEALTIDGIVARSGVAKTTIYRHWEGRDAIVRDVFMHCAPVFDTPPEDLSFRAAVQLIVDRVVLSFSDERWKKLFPELLRLRAQDPSLNELHAKLDDEQTGLIERIVAQGVTEGLLPASMQDDPHQAVMLLLGPLVMAAIVQPTLVDDDLVHRSTEQFLAGAKARLDAGE